MAVAEEAPSLPTLVEEDVAKPDAELGAQFVEPQSYSHTL